MAVEWQMNASIIHAKEFFEHELNLRERLDVDENGGGPGVRLAKRRAKKS
jgi:hypothetical protein